MNSIATSVTLRGLLLRLLGLAPFAVGPVEGA
jgi:hypothetical protein